jgi:transcriptional regulator with XRE-family HTH domain
MGARPQKQRNVLGLRLRAARERVGWSQAELARQLQLRGWDLGRTDITKIELRRRCITDYELLALAEVLRVPLQELTKGIGFSREFFDAGPPD